MGKYVIIGSDKIGGEEHMALYIILAIIVIVLIIIGVLFYMRSNKSQMIEKVKNER